jgi:hypothetical protein
MFYNGFGNGSQRILRREQADWLLAKKFFAESFFFALGEEILKNRFFTFKFFLSSTCTYTEDMFKFDAILGSFFEDVRYEMQVHEIIE